MANYIGVDVGKKSLQIYLSELESSFAITNIASGFNKLISILNKHYSDFSKLVVVFESTGGYERKLKEFLIQHKIAYVAVHPNKVRSFAKAKGLLAKTDKIDSKIIYDYSVGFNIQTKIDYSTEAQQKLHLLLKRREQIILCNIKQNVMTPKKWTSEGETIL
jgi:transposase